MTQPAVGPDGSLAAGPAGGDHTARVAPPTFLPAAPLTRMSSEKLTTAMGSRIRAGMIRTRGAEAVAWEASDKMAGRHLGISPRTIEDRRASIVKILAQATLRT